jgi:hypothetical protein
MLVAAAVGVAVAGCVLGTSRREGKPAPVPDPGTTSAPLPPRVARRLAAEFRPRLLFDSRERWRPLDVAAYFREGRQACPAGTYPTGCRVLRKPQQLTGAFIDLVVPGGQFGDPLTWRSPHGSCRAGVLLDCDTNATAAKHVTSVYYHAMTHGGYDYLDYWALYRYNNFWLTSWLDWLGDPFVDEHENDWEGMYVAVPAARKAATSFDFVGYAEHSGVFRYLPGSVTCGGAPCRGAARRVDDFVADGSQASYPSACRLRLTWFSFPKLCWQDFFGRPEQGHDGSAPWGANNDPTALVPFPTASSWQAWGGNWNSQSYEVRSPGAQTRYTRPWCAPDACPPGGPATLHAPGEGDPCAGWNGAGVAAVVCDPAQVARALADGTLGHSAGAPRISGAGLHTAYGNGIAQAMGAPLVPGQSIRITASHMRPGAVLMVGSRSRSRTQSEEMSVDIAGLDGTATLTVSAPGSASGRPGAAAPPRADLRLPSGAARLAAPMTATTALPTAIDSPTHVRVRAAAGRILVTCDSTAPRLALGLAASPGGALLRVVSQAAAGRPRRLSIPDAPGARYLLLAAVGPGRAVSSAVIRRVPGR